MNKILLLVVILQCIFILKVEALKCYTCTASSEHLDQRCITDPSSVEVNPITDCNMQYCITVRIEFLKPKNKVASLARTCVDNPLYTNEVIEAGDLRTYYTACQTDLCNGGSGKGGVGGGGPFLDDGEEIVLLVPGIDDPSSASSLSCYTVLIVLATIFINSV